MLTWDQADQGREFLGIVIIVLLRSFFRLTTTQNYAWTLGLYAIFQINCLMHHINIFKLLHVYISVWPLVIRAPSWTFLYP